LVVAAGLARVWGDGDIGGGFFFEGRRLWMIF
jgi:hypothetical protein